MIAARLAGGNLFLPFCGGDFVVGNLWWGIFGALGAARSTRIFFEGIFFGGGFFGGDFFGALGAARSTRIFFEGILFLGVVGCVLD